MVWVSTEVNLSLCICLTCVAAGSIDSMQSPKWFIFSNLQLVMAPTTYGTPISSSLNFSVPFSLTRASKTRSCYGDNFMSFECGRGMSSQHNSISSLVTSGRQQDQRSQIQHLSETDQVQSCMQLRPSRMSSYCSLSKIVSSSTLLRSSYSASLRFNSRLRSRERPKMRHKTILCSSYFGSCYIIPSVSD